MDIPPRYRLPAFDENGMASIEVWFEELLGKRGMLVFGSREKARPTAAAVELLKFAFKSGMGVGYFIDIYSLLNDARNTTYSTEDVTTVWQHCKDVPFLVLNNVIESFEFNERDQRTLAELLVYRQDHNTYTIVVIYGEGDDAAKLVNVFGKPVGSIISGFVIKRAA